jgi:pimeloyl-ACP methyl ester carboxylesterase
VSLRARLLHDVRYASLCLVDVVALRPWGSPFFELVKQHAEVLPQLPPTVHRGATEAYIQGASYRGLQDDELAMLVSPWVGDLGQAALYRQIAQADECLTAELEPMLGSIDEPTHIVWGIEDT